MLSSNGISANEAKAIEQVTALMLTLLDALETRIMGRVEARLKIMEDRLQQVRLGIDLALSEGSFDDEADDDDEADEDEFTDFEPRTRGF